MPLPQPQRYSVQDLAARWDCTPFQVEEMIRRQQFSHVIVIGEEIGGHALTRHIYFKKSTWPYGKAHHKNIGVHEVANFYRPVSETQDWRPSEPVSYLIPAEAVEAFEKEHELISASAGLPRLSHHTLAADNSRPKLLQIAECAHEELYVKRALSPKRGDRAQIEEWLHNHHPDLTKNQIEAITLIVNRRKGGAPKQSY